jgi:hypothetical protein
MTAREVQGQLVAELQQQLANLEEQRGAAVVATSVGGLTPADRVLLLARAYRHLAGSGEGRAPEGVMEQVLDAVGKEAGEPANAVQLAEAFALLAGPL